MIFPAVNFVPFKQSIISENSSQPGDEECPQDSEQNAKGELRQQQQPLWVQTKLDEL